MKALDPFNFILSFSILYWEKMLYVCIIIMNTLNVKRMFDDVITLIL